MRGLCLEHNYSLARRTGVEASARNPMSTETGVQQTSFVLTFLAILSLCALTFCTKGGGTCSSSEQLSIARSYSASRPVGVDSHRN